MLFYRLRLADILVRPMQRLTKYKILMEAIRKHISEESEAEIMDVMVSSEVHFIHRICGNKKFIETFSLFFSVSIIHAENLIAFMACFLYWVCVNMCGWLLGKLRLQKKTRSYHSYQIFDANKNSFPKAWCQESLNCAQVIKGLHIIIAIKSTFSSLNPTYFMNSTNFLHNSHSKDI